jgi:hypothetical protein
MDSRLLRRPVIDLLSGRSQRLLSFNNTARRHESSYRRTKQRLNVKPDASFLLSKNSPQHDHIIFNPPSSAPSVLHTPIKFLPKEDKRRRLLLATAGKLNSSQTTPLPPPIKAKPKVPHHHLSETDMAEIQRLKRQDPDQWTNTRLARKFNCSSTFISICLKECGVDNTERKKEMAAKMEAIKAKWGPRRRKARADTDKRYELAYRAE